MKKFNVTGICVPEEHYMADISGKIAQIKILIDNRSYFTINRARQYGKTTTLYEIRRRLSNEYIVLKTTFEGLGDETFGTQELFCPSFIRQIVSALESPSVNAEIEYIEEWADYNIKSFDLLSRHITKMCKGKKIVLMIDEVDRTGNNRVFLQFLSMLRKKFLSRAAGDDFTFHSVILAGVYDIKNIKLKMINEGLYNPRVNEGTIYNSPWNIAVNYDVDMSLSPAEISSMLIEYEADNNTGIDISLISHEIHTYTSGYPFLVSRICQCIDEELNKNWTPEGIREAIQLLMEEKNTLFDDLFKNLENNKDLSDYVYDILILGEFKPFMIYNPIVDMGVRYCFFKRQRNGSDRVAISNKIFELLMTDYYIAKDLHNKKQDVLWHDIIKDNKFNMELCLRKFADHYVEIFNANDAKFLERHGRLIFLSYLKPLINGRGFYHIESQFTDLRRMDIVIDYGCDQFIIELKLWKGEAYEQKAHEQLLGYMDSKKADTGYLLIFDFRKEANKERKTEWLEFDGKMVFEIIV